MQLPETTATALIAVPLRVLFSPALFCAQTGWLTKKGGNEVLRVFCRKATGVSLPKQQSTRRRHLV